MFTHQLPPFRAGRESAAPGPSGPKPKALEGEEGHLDPQGQHRVSGSPVGCGPHAHKGKPRYPGLLAHGTANSPASSCVLTQRAGFNRAMQVWGKEKRVITISWCTKIHHPCKHNNGAFETFCKRVHLLLMNYYRFFCRGACVCNSPPTLPICPKHIHFLQKCL